MGIKGPSRNLDRAAAQAPRAPLLSVVAMLVKRTSRGLESTLYQIIATTTLSRKIFERNANNNRFLKPVKNSPFFYS